MGKGNWRVTSESDDGGNCHLLWFAAFISLFYFYNIISVVYMINLFNFIN